MTDIPAKTIPEEDAKAVLVASPRGFCAGVVRAIEMVRLALQKFGPPVYVRKEIVHNHFVVAELAELGAIFVNDLDDVPDEAVVVYSAHGVSRDVRLAAASRRMRVVDATCPLVTKVHLEALRYARAGYTVVLVGHRDHDEVIGTVGEAPGAIQVIATREEVDTIVAPDSQRIAYLTQTTLSVDDTRDVISRLIERFPAIVGPADQDICYATQNRQEAVKIIAARTEVIFVVGARNSSNSNRLVEVAARAGCRAYLIESVDAIQTAWVAGCTHVGVTAGASTPNHVVEEVIHELRGLGFLIVDELKVVDEDVQFSLPRDLSHAADAASSSTPASI